MEQLFKWLASHIALSIEMGSALLILVGAVQASFTMLGRLLARQFTSGTRRQVWVTFGVWLMLGLEFELAADIIRTAVSPSWNDIGQLAAIATIRTALNFFLEKDIERYELFKNRQESVLPAARAA